MKEELYEIATVRKSVAGPRSVPYGDDPEPTSPFLAGHDQCKSRLTTSQRLVQPFPRNDARTLTTYLESPSGSPPGGRL